MIRTDFWLTVFGNLGGKLMSPGLFKQGSSIRTNPSSSASHTFASIGVNSHFHTLRIRKAEIQSCPAIGISENTSVAISSSDCSPFYHSHTITMRQAQLKAVMNGKPVVVTSGTSVDAGGYHSHDFTITKWF